MADPTTPVAPTPAPAAKTNRIGLTRLDYKGLESTLCSGCGHDSISTAILQSYYDLGISPHTVAKLSGIGCSSKTPAYFLSRAHGFNGVHGRMPTLATGALVANRNLNLIGVSGDGDTASIGMGHYIHMIRRNPRIVYIIENNGVYGLTKGQFSATAEQGSKLKTGEENEWFPLDCCGMAIQLGAGFVARSFSGDHKQMGALLKAAMSYQGLSILDVISPCITFNNHEGSTKSYSYLKDHDIPVHELGFVPYFDEVKIEIEPGTTRVVEMHDGSRLTLRKLEQEYDPTDKLNALRRIEESLRKNEHLTGVLYIEPKKRDLVDLINMVDEPLATLPLERVRPSREALAQVMEELK